MTLDDLMGEYADTLRRMTPEAVRERIASLTDSSQTISHGDLAALSDLDGALFSFLAEQWPKIEEARRLQIMQMLSEIIEDNVDFDFRRVFTLGLDDDNAQVRLAALDGLWEDEHSTTLQRVLVLATRDPAPAVRAAAFVTLSHFAYHAALGELPLDVCQSLCTTLLDTVSDASLDIEIRRRAIEALGYFGNLPEARAELQRAYQDESSSMRESALVAMGRSMEEEWLPTIEYELHSQVPSLRYEAARAMGEFGEEVRSKVSVLLPLIDDEDSEVALMTIWALGQIGGANAKRVLERIERVSRDEARKQAAADALEELETDDDE